MPAHERIFYSDANDVRIGTVNAVFGRHKYGIRNIQSATLAKQRVVRWPGQAVMLLGMALVAYGVLVSPTWAVVGAVGIVSGAFNLLRKKQMYGLRIVTPKGPVLVLASQNKGYVETVRSSLHRAMATVREPSPAEPR